MQKMNMDMMNKQRITLYNHAVFIGVGVVHRLTLPYGSLMEVIYVYYYYMNKGGNKLFMI
jgi:hypothetical protein